MSGLPWTLVCIDCGVEHPPERARFRCTCGGVLDVVHDFSAVDAPRLTTLFDQRLGSKHPADRSGVWRYRELVLPLPLGLCAARGEGNTTLYDAPSVARYVGLHQLRLKHEGENPTASFKDRGMTVGVSMARRLGMTKVACASTGNTSASMASYAAMFGMRAFVFIPEGNVAMGKLSQALAYGARTIQIDGNFDDAMRLVEQLCEEEGVYLLNSLNPYRLEGQKAIGIEILQDLDWVMPDWIVLPGGNLGNNSAIGKAFAEMRGLALFDRVPRIAIIQAEGANPLYRMVSSGRPFEPVPDAETIATAIRIGNPLSWKKTLRVIEQMRGVVEQVSDQEIMDAKAFVDAAGIGAEPASCATVAGLRKLVGQGIIEPGDHVCGILTGHLLKDPGAVTGYHTDALEGIESRHANRAVRCPATMDGIRSAMN